MEKTQGLLRGQFAEQQPIEVVAKCRNYEVATTADLTTSKSTNVVSPVLIEEGA